MKTYIGTKVVNATPMTKDDFERLKGGVGLEQRVTGIHQDGYLVEYTDGGQPNVPGYKGYVSWSPKDVFERAYRQSVDFGDALAALKAGNKVAREGWNGKGMFVYLNKGSVDLGHPQPRTLDGVDLGLFESGDTGTVTRLPNINMRSASGSTVTGWLASQSDMLAEDWVIVP